MPRTIQIRDVDDEVYAGLVRRAGAVGLSVPEFLRRQATVLARQPSMQEWLAQVESHQTGKKPDRTDVVTYLDESRGPWPG